ncbi:glycoside hydrolase family protein [Mucilaginibacter aquatilis]|uniref:Family 43 glycosylhydrolase n=1 Tax=Mucilaginibacter aquatilis TaxID=1517760 RepID=A0A6I4I9H1_9SPHI|nr:glycoside hydrolase family protein [Mucilaginibacter aquatilis]MVN90638.1 family 43 glycosylhydrolase [Mucilaginibacter aquatilis]
MKRRQFIEQIGIASSALVFAPGFCLGAGGDESDFARRLKPVGRRLEMEGYYVWCNSPIEGPDGRIHLYFSRWADKKKMGGWINGSEICHAVADHPEAEFRFTDVILAPRGARFWDATTCHNPSIKFIDGKYCMFYMGNANGKTNTKRIGLATAPSPEGPWTRPDAPLLEAGPTGAWDDHCTTNPAFIKHPNGQYWLFYKSWNTAEYDNAKDLTVRGNRKYGLAIAETLAGPYIKYDGNPVVDFSKLPGNAQLEDAFVWLDKGKFKMLARDMGIFNHENGLLMESKNGKKWQQPKVAYYGASHYNIIQPPPPSYLKKYGRFERPQLLFQNGKPTYLFTASQGGKYMTSSSFLFKIT